MNQYGVMARDHWARWLPTRYAAIEDPDSFFSDLGTSTEQRIDSLALDLAGDDQPGEGYLAKAGRLGEARHRAEQIVVSEDVLLEPGCFHHRGFRADRSRAYGPAAGREAVVAQPAIRQRYRRRVRIELDIPVVVEQAMDKLAARLDEPRHATDVSAVPIEEKLRVES